MSENDKLNTEVLSVDLDAHRTIVIWLFLATFSLIAFTVSTLLYSDKTGNPVLSTMIVVVIAGVFGSFVSALNRIYSSSDIFPNNKYRYF